MNKTFSLGSFAKKTLFPLVLALPLVSCYQPTEKTLVSRPPSSYGERPGQGYASVALERQDSGRGVVAVERVPSGAGGAIVADSSGSFDLDGLELASVEGQAPTYAAYESLSEGGLSLGEGVSSAGLNTPYRSTTLSDADVGGAMSLLEQVGRSGGGLLASQALGYGNSYLNRAGEGLLTGLVEGSAARLNFRLNGDGDFSGEGDAFLPFYDSTLSTAFAQIGVRSMDGKGADAGWKGLEEDTRWIGNFGVGQRWYPFAQGQGQGRSDGPWMVGYNAFLDADFSRSHLRGGVGLETQYDWMHLAGNYYFPLSGWKDGIGEDADRNIVYQERAAEGFDLRLKGYVPFYRNVAVTGSYGQWFGKHVSGSNTNDPSSWSYGVEYTPIPLLTAYVRQEELDGGKSSTDFGIRLTYRGGMSWEEQVSHAKVADLTKMTRNAFVERENRIITEQRQKASDPSGKSKFGLDLVDKSPFKVDVRRDDVTFRVLDPQDPSGVARGVHLTLEWENVQDAFAHELPLSAETDKDGYFTIETGLTAKQAKLVMLTVTHDDGSSRRTAVPTELSLEEWPVRLVDVPVTRMDTGSRTFQVVESHGEAAPTPVWDGKKLNVTLKYKSGKTVALPAPVTIGTNGEFSLTEDVVKDAVSLVVKRAEVSKTEPDQREIDGKEYPLTNPDLVFEVKNAPTLYKGKKSGGEIAFFVALRNKGGGVNIPLEGAEAKVNWAKAGFDVEGLSSTLTTDARGLLRVPAGALTPRETGDRKVDVELLNLATLPGWIDNGGGAVDRKRTVPLRVVSWDLVLKTLTPDPFYVGVAKDAKFRLEDASGKAVANQSGIALSWNRAGVFEGLPATVSTDAQGEFALPGLKGLRVGETALTAKLPDGGPSVTSAPLKVEGVAMTVELVSGGPFYEGIEAEPVFLLKDVSGEPVRDEKNIALSWGTDGVFNGLPPTVGTNRDGKFSLPGLKGLRVGETALTAKLTDGRTAASPPLRVVSRDLVLKTLTSDPFYVGVAKDAKFRLEDASGRAVASQSGIALSWVKTGVFEGLPPTVATDAKGEFTLPGLRGLTVDETALTAKLTDGRTATSAPVKSVNGAVTLSLLTTDPFYVGIAKEARFSLTDASGKALANQGGVALSWVKAGVFEGLPPTVTTDAKGEFTLPSLKGLKIDETALTATLSDGRSATSVPVKSVGAGVTLSLLTTDPFYVGVAKEARFSLTDASGKALANQGGVALSWVKAGVFEGLPPTVTTDAKGEFTLPGLKGLKVDETALTAKLADGRTATSTPVKSVSAGVTLNLLTTDPFYVGVAKEARFSLTDASGNALANQSGVALSWVKAGVFEGLPPTVATDAKGEFTLPGLKGLKVDETALTATLADGRSATSVPVKSVSAGVTLSLLTTDPFYVGVAKEARFSLTDASGNALANQSGVALSWVKAGVFEGLPPTVATDAKGEFTLPGLKGLKVDETALTATLADGRSATSVPVKSVSAGVTLSLLTTDPFYVGVAKEARFSLTDASGKALANQGGVALSWVKAGVFEGLPPTVTTDAKGEFTLPGLKGLKVDETALTATLSDGRSATSVPVKSVSAGVTLSLLTTDPFYVGVAKEARFSLTDASGKALANQGGVALSWVKAGVFEGLPPTVTTDAKGEFTLPGLKGLKVDETALTAKLADGRTATSTPVKSVSAGVTLSLLTTDPFYVGIAKEARFSLTDASGNALANQGGVGLSWVKAGVFEGLPPTVATDAKGEFSVPGLKGLKVDETALTATLADKRSATSVPVKSVSGTVTLSLKMTGPYADLFYVGDPKAATFRLADASGQALANQGEVALSWTKSGVFEGLPPTVTTDAQGEFTLPSLKGLKLGKTVLTARLADGRTAMSDPLQVTEPMALVLVKPKPFVESFYVGITESATFRLTDIRGQAVANQGGIALSWAKSKTGVFEGLPPTVSTDARGEFTLPSLKGLKVGDTVLWLELPDPDGRAAVYPLYVESAEVRLTLLTPDPFYVGVPKDAKFRLEDASGKAVANKGGVALSWVKAGVFEGLLTTVSTDAKGEFTLPGLKGLKVDETALTATLADKRSTTSAPVKAVNGAATLSLLTTDPFYAGIAKEATFRLTDGSGNALANQSGIGLSWVKTGVFDGLPATVATDGKGEFSVPGLKGLRIGETALTAKLTDGRTAASVSMRSVSAALTLEPVSEQDAWLEIGDSKDLTYFVKDSTGAPVRNQRVTGSVIRAAGDLTPGGYKKVVTTTAEGKLVLPGVDAKALNAKPKDTRMLKVVLRDGDVDRIGSRSLLVRDLSLRLEPVTARDGWLLSGEAAKLRYYVKNAEGTLLRNVVLRNTFKSDSMTTTEVARIRADGIFYAPSVVGTGNEATWTVEMASGPKRTFVLRVPIRATPAIRLVKTEKHGNGAREYNSFSLRLDNLVDPVTGKPVPVTWRIEWVDSSQNQAVARGWERKTTGLEWGNGEPMRIWPDSIPENPVYKAKTDMEVRLNDVVGKRDMMVAASVSGLPDLKILLKSGPLSLDAFLAPPQKERWFLETPTETDRGGIINGALSYAAENATRICKGTVQGVKKAAGRFPQIKTASEIALLKVGEGSEGLGAAYAAGWPSGMYWTDYLVGMTQTLGQPYRFYMSKQIALGGQVKKDTRLRDEGYLVCAK